MRFNKYGRLALSAEQRTASSWIGGCFLLAVAFFLLYLVRPSNLALLGMIYCGLLLMPLAVTFNAKSGKPRVLMAAYTTVIGLFAVPTFSILVLGRASPWKDSQRAIEFFQYFAIGAVLATWISAFLGSRIGDN